MLEPVNQSQAPVVGGANVPQSLTRRSQKEMMKAAEAAVLGATSTEAALMVTYVGLQGAEVIAGRLIEMHERHGDVALHVSAPIVQAYGTRVSSIINGLR